MICIYKVVESKVDASPATDLSFNDKWQENLSVLYKKKNIIQKLLEDNHCLLSIISKLKNGFDGYSNGMRNDI